MGGLTMAGAAMGQDGQRVSLRVEASMPSEPLEAGEAYAIRLETTLTEGWSASAAGIPEAMVQIDVPHSVRLLGRELTTLRELARNDYVHEPWERLIEVGESEIEFRLECAPEPGETIGLNVLAYVAKPGGEDAVFLRRRVELPVKSGASAWTNERATVSDWGINGTLQLGEKATAYTLPRADGSTVDLSELIGETPLVITTYRAFW